MARHATGEKRNATKPERKHAKAVDREIRNPTAENKNRSDRTFDHMHSRSTRYSNRQGY